MEANIVKTSTNVDLCDLDYQIQTAIITSAKTAYTVIILNTNKNK